MDTMYLNITENFNTGVCIFIISVPSIEAGECCNSYEDAVFTEHSAQYCPDYCCGTRLVKLFCCSNEALRTGEDNRDDFCIDWFGNHL